MVLHGLEPGEAHAVVDSLVPIVRPGGTAYVVVPDPGELVDGIVETLVDWSPVVAPVTQAGFQVVDELPDTERGEGGFGHTGI